MSVKNLKKMIKKFEKTNSFEVKSGGQKKSISSMSLEDVAIVLQEEMSNGV